jgi:hypothetical protein
MNEPWKARARDAVAANAAAGIEPGQRREHCPKIVSSAFLALVNCRGRLRLTLTD